MQFSEAAHLLYIRPRYSSAAANTTKIDMQNSSDMNAVSKYNYTTLILTLNFYQVRGKTILFFRQYVYMIPRVVYGLEVLTCTLSYVQALERLQHDMLRRIQALPRSGDLSAWNSPQWTEATLEKAHTVV